MHQLRTLLEKMKKKKNMEGAAVVVVDADAVIVAPDKQKQRDHKKRQRGRRKDEHLEVCEAVVSRCAPVFKLFPLCALALAEVKTDFDDMPASLSPSHNLSGDRAARKKEQCVSFARALAPLLAPFVAAGRRARVVDFGSGSGNASLPLVWWFRNVADFVLVDRFEEPILIARRRVAEAGVKNVIECVVSHIADADVGPFDIVFSSHACGTATDDALRACLEQGASSFCLISCCVGKLKFEEAVLPRSALVRELASKEEFLSVARSGDHDSNKEWSELKSSCKLLLELDRLQLATEQGYQCWRTQLDPPSCSPKNDVIIGTKKESV